MIIEREKRTITFNPVGAKEREKKETRPPRRRKGDEKTEK